VIRGLPGYAWFPVQFKDKPDAGRMLRISFALALVAIEGYRWNSRPVLTLDGEAVGVVESFPATQYRDRHLQVIKSTD
jgi:hypothetical protein